MRDIDEAAAASRDAIHDLTARVEQQTKVLDQLRLERKRLPYDRAPHAKP